MVLGKSEIASGGIGEGFVPFIVGIIEGVQGGYIIVVAIDEAFQHLSYTEKVHFAGLEQLWRSSSRRGETEDW